MVVLESVLPTRRASFRLSKQCGNFVLWISGVSFFLTCLMVPVSEVDIGGRVEIDGEWATVRYHGPLEGRPGLYCGVEWDRPGRGKHNGFVEGKRYFECGGEKSGGGGSGSLVGAGKMVWRGVGLLEALEEKYGGGQSKEIEGEAEQEQPYVLTSTMAHRTIEMVGMQKMMQIDWLQLTVVSLASMHVSHLDPQLLVNRLPALRDLDLSSNGISDLAAVLTEVSGLPLTTLHLSFNPLFVVPSSVPSCPISLTTLALISTGINWPSLLTCLAALTVLETLDLSDNVQLAEFPPSTAVARVLAPTLQNLHLNGCNLVSWNVIVAPLGHLSNLKRLFLSHNPLCHVEEFQGLDALEVLAVAHTQLDGFDWVKPLQRLERLRHIRFVGTPCHQQRRSRLILLGMLPQLTTLNGADVAERERLDANILREQWDAQNTCLSVGMSAAPLPSKEPLYVKFTSSSGLVSGKLLVSPETTVSLLRDLAFKHTNVPPFRQNLWALVEGQVGRAHLDQAEYTLDWYGFLGGLVDILVEEKPSTE